MCRRWLCASYIPTYGSGLRPVCASKVPVKCPLSKVSIMVKDPGAVNKNNARRKKRRLLQLGRRKRLAKKSVRARPMPGGYQSWPVLRPYDLMQHMLAAGLESELLPAKNFEVSFIYCGVFVRVYTYISIYDYVRRTFRVYLTYGFALFINTISTRAFQILRILKISDAFKIFNF